MPTLASVLLVCQGEAAFPDAAAARGQVLSRPHLREKQLVDPPGPRLPT